MWRSHSNTNAPAPSDAQRADRRRRLRYGALVALCFALGTASRFYGAWACRYIRNPDAGIVALMVKHMAAGENWPVFFYGQAYMGSLEPLLSVLATFMFGVTGLAVCAGTALAAVATLPVLFLWGRDAGGKPGALAALALCGVGPYYYFLFQFAPRGGYTVTLLLGLLTMWLSTRTAVRMQVRGAATPGALLGIGVLAGLGWWTNQLITPALFAAAAILAIGLRGRVWTRGPWLGLLGFLLGSLPFWIWNARHDWVSFDMFSSVGGVGLGTGFRFLWERYERLIGLSGWPAPLRTAVLLLYPGGMLLGALNVPRPVRLRRLTRPTASAITLSLFVAASILLFVRSSFAAMNTARYLIPLVPAGAILFGMAIRRLHALAGPLAAALPIVLLMATHWPALPELRAHSLGAPQQRAGDAALGQFLAQHRIDAVYSHFMDHALNFNLDESIVVTDVRGDRYPPYARHAERADRIAVLRNYGHVADFAAVAGGTLEQYGVGGYGVRHGFTPPAGGLTDITEARLTAVIDRTGADHLVPLTDSNIDTGWVGQHAASQPESIELIFNAPTPLRGVRLLAMGAHSYPGQARVEVKARPTDAWTPVHAPHAVTDYFWSGPRPYWGGRRQRLEYRFDDVTASRLRIVSLHPRRPGGVWRISELRCFGPGPDAASCRDGLPRLLRTLDRRSIRTLYCDRWEANRVAEHAGTTVSVELVPAFFPDAGLRGGSVDWNGHPAFLVQPHDLQATRAVLEQARIAWTETNIDPWILLEPHAGARPAAEPFNLYWTGTRLLRCSDLSPATRLRVEFPNGITLVGVTVHPRIVQPGDDVAITWFWELTEIDRARNVFVFVHCKAGDDLFQDDHKFFGADTTWRGTQGGRASWLWDRRQVRVPAEAAAGTRTIHMGLYLPAYGKRLAPRTELPTHRRAVVLTNAFSIIPAGEER